MITKSKRGEYQPEAKGNIQKMSPEIPPVILLIVLFIFGADGFRVLILLIG